MKAIAAALAALAIAGGTVGTSSAATAVSSNWGGYAVTGKTFEAVSGTWVQPAANCSSSTARRRTTASAFWVGLGGDSDASSALEQTGTEADCLADGRTRYTAWYELVPASSVRVSLRVSAGDRISGSVRVNGTKVTVQLAQPDDGKELHEDAPHGLPRHRIGGMDRRGPVRRHARRDTDPAADRLRHDPLHERDRDLDRRPQRHHRRLRMELEPDPARSGQRRPRQLRALCRRVCRHRSRARRALLERRLLDHLAPDRRRPPARSSAHEPDRLTADSQRAAAASQETHS